MLFHTISGGYSVVDIERRAMLKVDLLLVAGVGCLLVLLSVVLLLFQNQAVAGGWSLSQLALNMGIASVIATVIFFLLVVFGYCIVRIL